VIVMLRSVVGKMENSGIQKNRPLTAAIAKFIQCGTAERYQTRGFEPRRKAVMHLCTVGMVSLIAGCAGTAGYLGGSAEHSTLQTGQAPSQVVGECSPWDNGCQLGHPMSGVFGGSETDAGERGHDGSGTEGGGDNGGDRGGRRTAGSDTGGGDTGGGDTGGGDTGGGDTGGGDTGGGDTGGGNNGGGNSGGNNGGGNNGGGNSGGNNGGGNGGEESQGEDANSDSDPSNPGGGNAGNNGGSNKK
jgi:hypothetical protein